MPNGTSQRKYWNIKKWLNTRNEQNKNNQSKINRLITTLSKTIALPSNYSYITHHATVYGNVPFFQTFFTLLFVYFSQ